MSQIYLNIPFSLKDEVKKLGARYDPDVKKWYITKSQIEKFRKYLPVEIQFQRKNITNMVIPQFRLQNTLINFVSPLDYSSIKQCITLKGICENCGQKGNEMGEIYSFDNEVQKLEDLMCLCCDCKMISCFKYEELEKVKDKTVEILDIDKKKLNSLISRSFTNAKNIKDYDYTLIKENNIQLKELQAKNLKSEIINDECLINGYFSFIELTNVKLLVDFIKNLSYFEIGKILYEDDCLFLYCFYEEDECQKIANEILNFLKYNRTLEFRNLEKKCIKSYEYTHITKVKKEEIDIDPEIMKQFQFN